jgi:hypothetical protein
MSPDIKSLWQNQPMEDTQVSLSDLQSRAASLKNRVRWRNVVLYLYSLFNIVAGGWLIYRQVFPAMTYPMILMIGAHLFVLWQVVTRVGNRRAPDGSTGQAGLSFLREQFERQRKALSGAWLWYILPFMPPFVWELGIWLHNILARPDSTVQAAQLRMFAATIVGAILFWGTVFWLFQRGARRWKDELRALDGVAAE